MPTMQWYLATPMLHSINFFINALSALSKDLGMDELLPIVMEVGRFNLLCMELLDTANTESFGDPVPVTVPLTVEKGPFIIVTGHDLSDIKQLLEQTKDTGINIYTHGEMLPAHAYPELKKYPHLKGNLGTAWQNQQKEFATLPAPILFTTNCLMPPKSSYADRVFTTGSVQFPNTPYIKDETAIRTLHRLSRRLLSLAATPLISTLPESTVELPL